MRPYGTVPVLYDVSFDIHAGRTVAVVGESGSGKSTAARCITGLLPPTSGQIHFDGTPLPGDYRKRNKNQLRQCQMIYQMADTALNPRKRIGEIIGVRSNFTLACPGWNDASVSRPCWNRSRWSPRSISTACRAN